MAVNELCSWRITAIATKPLTSCLDTKKNLTTSLYWPLMTISRYYAENTWEIKPETKKNLRLMAIIPSVNNN